MALAPQTTPRRPLTLVERLAGEAARIRGRVHGCVGDRPYRVSLVVRRWSGGEPGRGGAQGPVEVSRVELRCGLGCDGRPVPPKLVLSGEWSRTMGGVVEEGAAVLEELDPTYTEAELSAYGRLPPGDVLLVEVTQDGRDGDAPDRPVRRYTLDAAPYRNAGRAQWTWRLRSQEPSAPFGNAQLAEDGGLP